MGSSLIQTFIIRVQVFVITRGIHGLSELLGIMALGIRLYGAPIPHYTPLVKEMNMDGRRVGYLASCQALRACLELQPS